MRDRRVLSRQTIVSVGTAALTALLTGCAPWLAANPQFASDSAHNPGGTPATTKPAGGPPDIAAPKNDLAWKDCTSKVFGGAGTPAAPGVILECANYDADLDPIAGATGTLSIGVVRARSVQTPPDAGPLVFTTGTDVPSSLQLPVWLSRSGADVLKSHPVVSVDRRGIGMSSPVDCRDAFDRQEMRDQAQFESGDDPVANLGAITMTATTGCTDTIAPGDSAYDNARAAEFSNADFLASQSSAASIAERQAASFAGSGRFSPLSPAIARDSAAAVATS